MRNIFSKKIKFSTANPWRKALAANNCCGGGGWGNDWGGNCVGVPIFIGGNKEVEEVKEEEVVGIEVDNCGGIEKRWKLGFKNFWKFILEKN